MPTRSTVAVDAARDDQHADTGEAEDDTADGDPRETLAGDAPEDSTMRRHDGDDQRGESRSARLLAEHHQAVAAEQQAAATKVVPPAGCA